MTYPAGIVDGRAELQLNGVWTDVSAYVFNNDLSAGVAIGRGAQDESPGVNPSDVRFGFDNHDGRFAQRNPTGPYYPYLVQNTPVRFSVPEGASYLRCEATGFDFSSAPDSAGTSVTGSIDIRVDVTLDNWNSAQVLAGKWTPSGNQRSWILLLNEDGTLSWAYSPDGTAIRTATTTSPVPVPPLRRAGIRVTYNSGTGQVIMSLVAAGPNQALSGPINAGWAQVGAPIVLTFGSIFDSTAPTRAGAPSGGASADYPAYSGVYGKVHYLEVRNGIAGTVVASPDFTAATAGASSFNDAQGNTWTNQGGAEISNRRYRCHAETVAFPQSWDPTGSQVMVAATAAGLWRRLGQSSKPLRTPLRRYWVKLAGVNVPVAYWHCEDAVGGRFASGLSGGTQLDPSGKPSLAADAVFAGSLPIPKANGATNWQASVPSYAATGTTVLRFLLDPDGAISGQALVANIYCTGTASPVQVAWLSPLLGPAINVTTPQIGIGQSLALPSTSPFACSIEFAESGGNYTVTVRGIISGQASVLSATSGATAGSIGRITGIRFFPADLTDLNGTLGGGYQAYVSPLNTAAGHIALQTAVATFSDLASPMNGWNGEPAGSRFSRLCAEEGVTFRGRGQLSASSAVGVQTPVTLPALLQECADVDRGVIFEPRQVLGLGYRTRASLYNQAAAIALDYAQADLTGMQPGDDDQNTLNDVEVTRTAGGTRRRVQASGPKSVQAPPAGVGIYDTAFTLNVWSDSQAADEAGWILHLGTVDENRFPLIQFDLSRAEVQNIYHDLQDADLGDRWTCANAPVWVSPNSLSELIRYQAERIGGRIFQQDWTSVPESPYQVAVADDAVYGRADTDGSTVHAGGFTSGADSFQVDTAAGSGYPLWTTAQADFPFDINVAGERITVTDINGPPINFLAGNTRNFDGSLGTWAGPSNCTLALQTGSFIHSGSGAMRMRSAAAGDMLAGHCDTANILTQGLPCSPGDVIALAAWFMTAFASRTCKLGCNFYTNVGVFVSTIIDNVHTITDSTSGYTKLIASVTAPATSALAKMETDVLATGAANEDHFVDDVYMANATTGGVSVQSFTGIRSVNGVIKAHVAGEAVALFFPPYAAM